MSAELINIRRDVGDKFYRYKMPRIMSKIEGRGNGIKTVIPNLADVAKALSRSPVYLTKFFGIELGSQVIVDVKTDRFVVNGVHDSEKLQNSLDAFITKFVICPSCLNPETDLEITKQDDIMRNCKACGAIKIVDMRHKLCAFITKNPPEKKKKDKKIKKSGDASPQDQSQDEGNQDGSTSDDALTRRINDEAALLSNTIDMNEDWAEDTSPEAVAARMKELELNQNDTEDLISSMDLFSNFVLENLTLSPDEIYKKSIQLDIRIDRAATILAQILFDSKINIKSIQKYQSLLSKFLTTSKAQKGFLGGIERLIGVVHPELIPKTAAILKLLYDSELIEEDAFLAWGERPSKKYVEKAVSKEIHSKADPFLNWLKEAEEEESEDESEQEK